MNRAWIELDMQALRHNVEEYRRILPDTCKLLAIVKADAYGHGAVKISNELVNCGIDFFGVASLEEAIELREAGIKEDILILGYTDPAYFDKLAKYDITQAIVGAEYGFLLKDYCIDNRMEIKGHIAIDSGMHRIGFYKEEMAALKSIYAKSPLKITGIFTHMCVANEEKAESVDYTNKQIEYFYDVIDALKAEGIDPGMVHLLSSFASINYKNYVADYARIGVLMYGNKTEYADYLAEECDFRPVLSLKARVTSVRWIEPGETVSYGRWFTAARPTKIATLAIGYADGLPRSLSNGNIRVLINGEYARGTGRICMDQMMVDVTDIEEVNMGDVAILIGTDGVNEIRAEEVAERAGSITHELFSRLGRRLERP